MFSKKKRSYGARNAVSIGEQLLRQCFRVQPAPAIGTNSVGEVRFAMLSDVNFQIMPEALLVANLAAGGADRQQSAQALDAGQGVLHLGDQALPLRFCRFPLADIAHDDAGARFARGIAEYNRRDFYSEERTVRTTGTKLSMSPASRLPLFNQGCQTRIGYIHEPVPSFSKDLLAGTAQYPARGRIRIENSAIGRSEHDAIKAVLEQHGIKGIVASL